MGCSKLIVSVKAYKSCGFLSFAGKHCTGATILQHRRIRALCEFLASLPSLDGEALIPTPDEFEIGATHPLSFGQEQMLMLHSLDPSSGFYNQPLTLGLYGAVDTALLDRCVQTIVSRHDALRTVYKAGPGGTWVPNVAEGSSAGATVPLSEVDLSTTMVSAASFLFKLRGFILENYMCFERHVLHYFLIQIQHLTFYCSLSWHRQNLRRSLWR